MATLVVSSIGSGGSYDYATIEDWLDDAPANLVTADVVWQGELYQASAGYEFTEYNILIAGGTSDATRYKHLTAAAGHSFADKSDKTLALKYNAGNGVGINTVAAGGYAGVINLNESFAKISRLQMKAAGDCPDAPWFCSIGLVSEGVSMRDCFFEQTADRRGVVTQNTNVEIVNFLMVNSAGAIGGPTAMLSFGFATTPKLINAAFYRPSNLSGTNLTGVARSDSTNALVRNVAVFGCATAFAANSGSWHASSGYNATDAATAPGSNNQVSKTFSSQIQGATSGAQDWRAKATGDLAGHGTRDQIYTLDQDMLGQNRSPSVPYIGPHEVAIPSASEGSGSPTDSNDIASGSGVGATSASGSGSATDSNDSASGVSSQNGMFTSDPVINNTGSLRPNLNVYYSWFPGGRIGHLGGITPIEGQGETNSEAILIVIGLPAGNGVMQFAKYNTGPENDDVFYQAGTVT